MTLNPTNETVRHDNHAEKNLFKGKNNRHNPGGHDRCKDSITIKKAKGFVRVGERVIAFNVLAYIYIS
jgi:hypothetical protein